MRSGRPPGTLLRFEVDRAEPPAPIPVTSTHGLSLNEAIGLGRALGRLPHGLVVVGIEVTDLSPGSGLSSAVAESVPAAVDRVLDEIDVRDGGRRA
jgi:hydrogenase maturation protease